MSTKPTLPIEYKINPSQDSAAPQHGAAVTILVRVSAAMKRYFENRKAIHMLSALDDHILADIGLTRGDVRSVTIYGSKKFGSRANATTRLRILAVERRAGKRPESYESYISGDSAHSNVATNQRPNLQGAGV